MEKKKQLLYFKKYIYSIHLDKQKKFALVDIGWKGTIQDNLSKILPNQVIHGLYFGYYKGFNQCSKNNIKQGLISNEENNYWYEKQIFHNGPLFEMSTTPGEGSCSSYNLNGPITRQYKSEKNNYKQYFSKTQKAIYDYAKIYKKYKEILQLDSRTSHYLPLDQVIRFISYPNKDEANSFLRYTHKESFGVNETSKFTFKPRWRYVFSDINPLNIAKRAKDNFFNQFWIQGVIRRSNIPFGNFIYNIIKGD